MRAGDSAAPSPFFALGAKAGGFFVGLVCSPWPEQAPRANIHAQISLALNRIYTEWYPSKGYSFNITNSTSYDQYYVQGREVFEVMQRITDDIFNTYVRRQGNIDPYYTEYCDGKQVTCKGMKQWGTVSLAEQGKNALQILQYYYGSDIEVVRTNRIQAIPESYPGTPLRRGSTGTAVRTLQRQLNRIAQDYPSFGTLNVDGVFGAATEEVVKKFQKQFSLTQDGVVPLHLVQDQLHLCGGEKAGGAVQRRGAERRLPH